MSEAIHLILALGAGLLLGALFFGGLWWTVRRGLASPSPALWFGCSLLLRTGIVLGGFYFVAADSLERMIACLLGFVVARLVVTRLTATPGSPEDGHAS